jgi:hypothetical protein
MESQLKFIKSKKGFIIIIIFVLFIGSLSAFLIYVSDYYHSDNTALATLSSSGSYTVWDTTNSITFTPKTNKSTTGIIFYPGAKVQPEAYSVLASKLA